MARALSKLAVTALLAAVALPGCTRGGNGAKPARSTGPTGTGSPASPSGSPVALSATGIADKLGCTSRQTGQKAATDPVDPVEAVDCTAGGATYRIRTYRSNAERDQVLRAAPVGGGYRNVGERSLVATDTEQAATHVLEKTGATIVDLRYTTPGS